MDCSDVYILHKPACFIELVGHNGSSRSRRLAGNATDPVECREQRFLYDLLGPGPRRVVWPSQSTAYSCDVFPLRQKARANVVGGCCSCLHP